MKTIPPGKIRHIVFDHDGTLVNTDLDGGLFFGIKEMLDKLEQRGCKLYVWTARSRFSTVEFLRSLGIINRFEQLHCSTDGDTKPSPDGLESMLFGEEPDSVLVVGDSCADMFGAKSFGAYGIGAVWAYKGRSETVQSQALLDSGADDIAKSPQECCSKIMSLLA